MHEHNPLLQRHSLGRLHHRDVRRLRRLLGFNDRAFEHLAVKPGGHPVSDCIVCSPQCSNYPIEPRKLHSSCEAKHLIRRGLVPHRRVARRQKRKLGVRIASLDDTHKGERTVSHCDPGLERFLGVLRTVASEVDPTMVSEGLYSAVNGGRIARDGLE